VADPTAPNPSPLREITQPFVDLMHAPRALWALNLSYFLEGFVYFGTLTYLAMYFNQLVGLDDVRAGWMVGVLTSGITFSMLFFGSRVDRWGLRRTLLVAIALMFCGRLILALAPGFHLAGGHLWSPLNLLATGGILLIVSGFGMYQPAIYAGTRQVTTAATSSMAFAMLYAMNNLGAWLPSFMSPFRRAFGMQSAIGLYAFATLLGFLLLVTLLTRTTLEKAVAEAKTSLEPTAGEAEPAGPVPKDLPAKPIAGRVASWLKNHPLADAKFSFFIFCLIPVQTLFAYTWLVIPQYVARAYAGSGVGENFEVATNLNALLIFILCPVVAALSARVKVYHMMIYGTAVMASSAFLLAPGPSVVGLFANILVLSVGEAMWQPRFLQYAAEIAPEGRTGAYMGVAQFPWFLTKMLVPLYSGACLARWCPEPGKGYQQTGLMWLVFGGIAVVSTLFLVAAKGWLGRDFKTRA
jgi:proton-dependent oligopeptide transporter, POT family